MRDDINLIVEAFSDKPFDPQLVSTDTRYMAALHDIAAQRYAQYLASTRTQTHSHVPYSLVVTEISNCEFGGGYKLTVKFTVVEGK